MRGARPTNSTSLMVCQAIRENFTNDRNTAEDHIS